MRGPLLAVALAAAALPALAQEAADPAARVYLDRCAPCHTIGGGELAGPDLEASTAWPDADLALAVERMEKNVGPLSDEEVAALVELLQDAAVHERLAAAEEAAVAVAEASAPPASPERGRALFHGTARFAAGGMPCAACHRAGAAGGTLAVPLDDAFARLGRSGLTSAALRPGFPAMQASYRAHAIAEAEARDLVAYLEGLDGASPGAPAGPPVTAAGAAGGVLVLAGLALVLRRRRGVRRALVESARSGRGGGTS